MVRSTGQSWSREDKDYIEMASRYNILRNGKVIFENVGQIEYFDIMEDFAIEYYQSGTPNPNEITFELIED